MFKAPLYLSRPAVRLPSHRLSNDEVIDDVRRRYRGEPEAWKAIEAGIRYVFDRCNSGFRYLEPDQTLRVGEFAGTVAKDSLAQVGLGPADVDLLISTSVAREYYEPATAMEVAACVGATPVHAFDVTSACVGQLEGIQVAAGLMEVYPTYRNAVVASGELTRAHLCYEIQAVPELATKAAGLTIGNAAAAFVLGRTPFPGGCLEVLGLGHVSLPQHWHLCQAPVGGTFMSEAQKLFKLNVHVAPELRRTIEGIGWTVDQVDHFILHQPGEFMNHAVLAGLGVDLSHYLGTHYLYGNTVSTSVALNLHEALKQDRIRPGQRLVLGSAAAGFSLVAVLGIWRE